MLRSHFRITLASGLLMAIVIIAGLLAGCGSGAGSGSGLYGSGGGGNSSSTPTAGTVQTTCASSAAAICTRSVTVNSSAKQVLVASSGRTLYYFSPDSATAVACTGACTDLWPPLLSSSATVAPIAGLTGALTTVSRSGGTQIVYNGHPLYTYSKDAAPGDAKGDGILGKWFVATPDLAPANGSNNNGYSNGY